MAVDGDGGTEAVVYRATVASGRPTIQKDVWRLIWICPFEPPGTVWIM